MLRSPYFWWKTPGLAKALHPFSDWSSRRLPSQTGHEIVYHQIRKDSANSRGVLTEILKSPFLRLVHSIRPHG